MSNRKKRTWPQQYLNAHESARLTAAIRSGDTERVVHYNNLIQERRTAEAQKTAQAQAAQSDTRKHILGYLVIGLGFIAFIVFVAPRLDPVESGDEPGQVQVQTSGPCDNSEKDGAIGDLAVEGTGWTTSWALAHDESGYWINPAGLAYGPPTGEIHVCVLHAANGYEVWMDPSEISGERKENWLPVKLHPED